MQCLAIGRFPLCFPTADIAAHLCLLTISVAGLVCEREFITMIRITGTDIEISAICIKASESIVGTDPFLPNGRHGIDEYSAADACAVETACGPFYNFE